MLPLLDAATRLTGYGRGIRETAPDLAAAFAEFPSPKALADQLRRALAEDGSVKDEASPALRRIRSRLRDLRKDIVRTLEAYFQLPAADTIFQERYVTVRHGRFVLPVAAGAKGRMRGIVHDRSQSGATLFVEPEGVVEANNELVQVIREEESEVLRVLAALTDAVREALPELEALLAGMAQLDLVFARAELGERMAATQPLVSDERVVLLRAARNPLLLAPGGEGARPRRRARRHRARRRAAPARHHGAQRGRQDGDAQDLGPARADGAVGSAHSRR